MADENEVEMLQKKAKYFYDNKVIIHIRFKKGFWKRGLILDNSSADFFILRENLEGEMPIFYQEILEIMRFNKPKDKGEWK